MYIQVKIFHNYSTCPDRVNENSKNSDNLYIQVNIFFECAVNVLPLLPTAWPAVHFSGNTSQTRHTGHIDKMAQQVILLSHLQGISTLYGANGYKV